MLKLKYSFLVDFYITIIVLIMLTLSVLNGVGLISISWFWVFSPLLIPAMITLSLCVVLVGMFSGYVLFLSVICCCGFALDMVHERVEKEIESFNNLLRK
jgi:hypothetical protein